MELNFHVPIHSVYYNGAPVTSEMFDIGRIVSIGTITRRGFQYCEIHNGGMPQYDRVAGLPSADKHRAFDVRLSADTLSDKGAHVVVCTVLHELPEHDVGWRHRDKGTVDPIPPEVHEARGKARAAAEECQEAETVEFRRALVAAWEACMRWRYAR